MIVFWISKIKILVVKFQFILLFRIVAFTTIPLAFLSDFLFLYCLTINESDDELMHSIKILSYNISSEKVHTGLCIILSVSNKNMKNRDY
jgi:hypothetical protein